MRRIAVVFAVACLALAGCSSGGEPSRPVTVTAAVPSPTPSPSLSVSPECRTWIKAELLDSTDDIDAGPGFRACGDLSDAELQAAIDQVTEELAAEITPEP